MVSASTYNPQSNQGAYTVYAIPLSAFSISGSSGKI